MTPNPRLSCVKNEILKDIAWLWEQLKEKIVALVLASKWSGLSRGLGDYYTDLGFGFDVLATWSLVMCFVQWNWKNVDFFRFWHN